MIYFNGEVKGEPCICGGPCTHVIVTCLDCQESRKQTHPSRVAEFERKARDAGGRPRLEPTERPCQR